MQFDTLDDPFAGLVDEEDVEFIEINRYRISKPNEDELLFRQMASFTFGNIAGFLFFFGLGGFFAFLLGYYIVDEGFQPSMLFMLIFILGGWIPAGIVFVDKFLSKRKVLFTSVNVVLTSSFGKKTSIDRDSVKSVFIKHTTTHQKGSSTASPVHHYDIKLNTSDSPEFDLMNIQMKGVFYGNDYKRQEQANEDSLRICRQISNHWDIPVSVP